MRRFIVVVLLILLTVTSGSVYAQRKRSSSAKPQWLNNPPKSSNPQQQYIVVEDLGYKINDLRANSNTNLNNYIRKSMKTKGAGESILKDAQIHDYIKFLTAIDVDNYSQQKIDEYWEIISTGHYRYYCLYAVSTVPGASFDQVRVTDKYGMRGVLRSVIIPGWGQMYKKNTTKGALILGGTVAFAGGIIATENLRASYVKMMGETYDVNAIRSYANSADNMTNIRNICIGGAAALYIYNLIDAAIAPGAKRIIVPKVDSQMAGLSFAYKF